MKKLYLLETTSKNRWEMNMGYHLIWAENEEEAKINGELNSSEHVNSVKDVTELMKDTPFYTISESFEL